MLLAGHPDRAIAEQQRPAGSFEVAVVEHLRVKVPAEARQAWLEAERGSWDPWLAEQEGYLGRDLLWDPEREEGTLLIRWASREQWKAIPPREVEAVQERFEDLARQATGTRQGNPFPLVFEGELQPAA
ncbi:MAG: TIGR03792 family protein [Cyanobacteriota bacterium]|nr:TIGR03792 family protein [Cyanobacteriota bacterium]